MMIAIVMGMAIPAILAANASMSTATSQRLQIDDVQSKSSVSISSIQAPPLGNQISFVINNTGSIKLWDYQKFSVLVTYDALGGSRKTEEVAYQGISPAPSQGFWSISQFNNDYADPQIINPGESAKIVCHVSSPLLGAGGTVTVALSTDAGVVTSRSGAIV